MDVLVDPNVFSSAFTKHTCAQTLAELEQDKALYRFVVTRNLLKCYTERMHQRNARASNDAQLAISMAKHLVNGTSFRRTLIELQTQHPLPQSVQSQTSTCHLDEEDNHLLQIAIERCQARTLTESGPAIVLLLACGCAQQRCLQQGSFRVSLCEAIQGIKVHCAEDRNSIKQYVVDPKKLTNDQQHDARFEDQCALWLSRQLGLGCHTSTRRWGCEIDIFCEESHGNTHRFYLGECKLVHNNSGGQEKQEEALKQLKTRMQTGIKSTAGEVQWECFVFCNTDFDPDICKKAQQVAQEVGATMHLILVQMPSQWQQDARWVLRDEDFCEKR